MRYALPLIIVLALMNLYHVLKPVEGVGGQPATLTKEYRFSLEKDLALLKAQDEILILKMLLNGYRESKGNRENELGKLLDENLILNRLISGYREANTHRLRLTAYTARPQECNDDVDNTAIMQTPVSGWTVAVSRDLRGWLGKRVYIEGFGVRLVNDLMNARYTNAIDVLVADVPTAKRIGVRKNVLVTLVEPLATDVTDLDRELVALFSKRGGIE